MTFKTMISHLSYHVLRNDIVNKFDCYGKSNMIPEQIDKLQDLFRLNEIYAPNVKKKTSNFNNNYSMQ